MSTIIAADNEKDPQINVDLQIASSRDLFLLHFTSAEISSIWELILKDIIENRKHDVRRTLLEHKMLPIESAQILNSIN
jgi:hypothetical protein